jgi:orotidine-5'-phosphate decarboxylase
MPNPKPHATEIRAPIAIGELITILEIKAERIADAGKLRNVANELAVLRELQTSAGLDVADMVPHARELKSINAALWDIEDEIRELESAQDFGARFIALARGVYQANDRRAAVKNRISLQFGSAIVEAKSYKDY